MTMARTLAAALFIIASILASCAHTQGGPKASVEPKAGCGQAAVGPPAPAGTGGGEPSKAGDGPQAPGPDAQGSASPQGLASHLREKVEAVLVEGGLEEGQARALAYDPRLVLDEAFILRNLIIAPPKASPKTPGVMAYDQAYISKGCTFMSENEEFLEALRERYGTSPEVLTAVLIVESRLGTYPMRYKVASVLASMALAKDPAFILELKERNPGLGEALVDADSLDKAVLKARWAARELPELVTLARELDMDPIEIDGSVSGALGPAQFIPSTFRKYGVDGDGDGKRNPFAMKDAIASMANYIRLAGWREDADEGRMRGALWHYNHSEVYVNTVMQIYRELSRCRTDDVGAAAAK